MDKNKILIGLVVVLVVGGSAAMFWGGSPEAEKESIQQVQQNAENNSGAVVTSGDGNIQAEITVGEPKTFTFVEIATHNSASSCYTVVNGGVYDVTSFIGKHPGGEANILKLCGIDGSSWFNNQHGGKAQPEATLASLKIGILAQ